MNDWYKWKCFYTNANSIIAKIDELRYNTSGGNYDIIAITESWANEDINDSELQISGYHMYRKDRSTDCGKKGGGVLLYIKDTIRSSPLPVLTNDEFHDSVWCRLDSPQNSLIVGVLLQKHVKFQRQQYELIRTSG